MRKLVVIYLVMAVVSVAAAQSDTTMARVREAMAQNRDTLPTPPTVAAADTAATDTTAAAKSRTISPRRVALYSAILPGLGQIHNHKYWKLPLVYGGLCFGVYVINFNTTEYRFYKEVYFNRVNGLPDALNRPDVQNTTIKDVRDAYYKRMQQSWIYTGVFYFVQIADAFVDAHLATFDISDDLSVRPAAFPPDAATGTLGSVGFRFDF